MAGACLAATKRSGEPTDRDVELIATCRRIGEIEREYETLTDEEIEEEGGRGTHLLNEQHRLVERATITQATTAAGLSAKALAVINYLDGDLLLDAIELLQISVMHNIPGNGYAPGSENTPELMGAA